MEPSPKANPDSVGSITTLIGLLLLTFGGAALGGLFTSSSVGSWYQTELVKPSWTPPPEVFGPVWTVLYLAMAVAAWLAWSKAEHPRLVLTAYLVQLALNVAWSGLFFGLRSPLLGLLDIAALWCALVVCISLFAQSSKAASALMLPYLAWVSFASALNFAIWRLNSGTEPW